MKNSARWVRGYDLGSGQRKLIGKELRAGVQAEYKAVFSRGQMGAIGLQGSANVLGLPGSTYSSSLVISVCPDRVL